MKGSLLFAFFLMGFSFSVTQTLMARELLVSFAGNELSIGLVLGSWLVLEAIGSGILGRLAERLGAKAPSYASLQVILSLLLPLSLYAAFTLRRFVGVAPGEGVSLLPMLWSSFLILSPLGLVDGTMFTFGCKAYSEEAGHVYVIEAIGGIIGGLVFTYLFIPFFNSIQIILILAFLNLASAASINMVNAKKARAAATLLLLIATLFLLLSPKANEIHNWMVRKRWPGYNLVHHQNSIYGNVAVIRQEEQYTFFASGVPILTAPVPDVVLVEEMVHLPLLFHPDPKKVLVVSGGVGGLLREILKYPIERVDYAELDPLLIEVVKKFPTHLTEEELADERVNIEYVDGRLLVRIRGQAGEKYDLVIVNLPYPSTLQLNRFYTVDFFRIARAILDEDGILVLSSPGTLTYMSPGMRKLNVTIHETLRKVFPYVRPIPGDLNIWLASPSDEISKATLETILRRWKGRGIPTSLISDFHIRYKFAKRWIDWFWGSLEGERVRANSDLHPSGLLYGLFYWNELFSPRFSGFFAAISELNLFFLGAPLVFLSILLAIVGFKTKRFISRKAPLTIAIITTGFGGMAFDLIVILGFQSLYGYVYHWIGLLISAFMAGLSLGGLVMTRLLGSIKKETHLLAKIEVSILLYWVLFPIALSLLYSNSARPFVFYSVKAILLILNALAGFLVGLEFPLANKIYLMEEVSPTKTAGVIYASDLVGAFLGALLVSTVLLPSLGIFETCFLIVVLKLCSFSSLLGLIK
jgi:spermidine synthase